ATPDEPVRRKAGSEAHGGAVEISPDAPCALADARWILVRRLRGPDVLLGPYPDEAAAEHAMNWSVLVEYLCQEDAHECSTVAIDGFDPDWDVRIIDLDDPDHTAADFDPNAGVETA